ncbi:galactose mutarotase [Rhodobacter sp. KR11]|uniref:aldose epimerase family protein n=1 Tax=Rhodobacter sp. KR11 TaxID=2974588 RepID=UPI0022224BB5|nr:aldose epimerase family protein [Rhodobacter sp. KR11]MCW1920246.1 galactose mutarotase [Rhodobacter sp. KR11]
MDIFGQINGQDVPAYELRSSGGLTAKVIPWGARLISLRTPSRIGKMAEIILGHDRLQDYIDHPTYFGATCGRYANRIAGGRYGDVQLDINEAPNHLHGGTRGFDKAIWTVADHGPSHIRLTHVSPDGDMGYPGALAASVTYRFEGDDRLIIEMEATTTAPTVVNLVNHAYFNLKGAGDILDHQMTVAAEAYAPVGAGLIPTGALSAVSQTKYDFRQPTRIGDLAGDDGYDHNWCLNTAAAPAVRITEPTSGRALDLTTNEPGVQIYTCGMMPEGTPGRAGATYGKFAGLTLETQKYPDSPNNPAFPSAALTPGETYRHIMNFRFYTV